MSAAVEILETSTKSDRSTAAAEAAGARRKIVRRRRAARLVQISSSTSLQDALLDQRPLEDALLEDRATEPRVSEPGVSEPGAVTEPGVVTEAGVADRRAEASSFPASLLGGLRDVALVLQLPGVEGRVRVLTSREALDEAREGASLVFDEGEWAALVTGAESDRIWPQDVAAFCARKAADPRWTLDLETALAGARPEAPRGWSVGRVLERLGARLVAA